MSSDKPQDGATPPPDPEPEEVRPWQMRACHVFMVLVLLRLPFFVVPCAKGTFKSPLEIVAAELYAYDRAPHAAIRALLYPGAFAENLQRLIAGQEGGLPKWASLLDSFKNTTLKSAYDQPLPTTWAAFRKQQLDLVGGSFVVAFGALMALFGPSSGGTFGMALLFTYVYREGVPIHSYMLFATLCSLSWMPVHKLAEWTSAKKPRARSAAAEKKRKLRTKGKFKVY